MEEFCGRRSFDERSLDERQIPDTPGTKITIQEPYRHLGHGAGVDEVGEAPLRRGHRRPDVIVKNSKKYWLHCKYMDTKYEGKNVGTLEQRVEVRMIAVCNPLKRGKNFVEKNFGLFSKVPRNYKSLKKHKLWCTSKMLSPNSFHGVYDFWSDVIVQNAKGIDSMLIYVSREKFAHPKFVGLIFYFFCGIPSKCASDWVVQRTTKSWLKKILAEKFLAEKNPGWLSNRSSTGQCPSKEWELDLGKLISYTYKLIKKCNR